MPSLRDLTLERNQRLNQLRARIKQASLQTMGELSTSSYPKALDETFNAPALQKVPTFTSLNTLEQKTMHSGKQEEDQPSYTSLEKDQLKARTNDISETSDLKAKLAPVMEVLDKKTNEKIKSIIRKKILQEPSFESDRSS
ncbi:ntc20p [Saccharomyces arboricola H-6]|uniref:Ntc20p n=1 Tax=Saccharomyces arboricola (strain H-6 / AS 2.3317 / CBS 10644) TaxID=1160507 RepID=J8QAX2_SACAR|nr:ntc20p [Saccharomyces arboricola H-6]